jgi:hypothetical protein
VGGDLDIEAHKPVVQKNVAMRCAVAVLFALIAGSAIEPARADPYRWCAVYGGSDDSGTNCSMLTLPQCREAIAGMGGSCEPNQFYDGRPEPSAGHGSRTRSRSPKQR